MLLLYNFREHACKTGKQQTFIMAVIQSREVVTLGWMRLLLLYHSLQFYSMRVCLCSVCLYVCGIHGICEYVCALISIRVKVRGGCWVSFSVALHITPFRQCLSLSLKHAVLPRMTDQQAPRICLSLPLNTRVTGAWSLRYIGAEDLNSASSVQ